MYIVIMYMVMVYFREYWGLGDHAYLKESELMTKSAQFLEV